MSYKYEFHLDESVSVIDIRDIANNITINGRWVNAVNMEGETPLHIAAKNERFDLFQIMLPCITNIDTCNHVGNTIFHIAMNRFCCKPKKYKTKFTDIIRALISKGADVNRRNLKGWTVVHIAAVYCNIELLKILHDVGADFNLNMYDGTTPLNLACKYNSRLKYSPEETEIIDFLSDHCNVNATDNQGYSVLHYAVEHCSNRGIRRLINHQADVNCQTFSGKHTPLHHAIRTKNVSAAQSLIEAGADVNCKTSTGLTPLHFAVLVNSLKIVESLVRCRVDINSLVRLTPLHIAVYQKNEEICRFLLTQGADVNVSGIGGLTPLHLAAFFGRIELTNMLIDYGADVNCRDDAMHTPLLVAIRMDNREHVIHHMEDALKVYLKDGMVPTVPPKNTRYKVIELLLRRKADVNAVTGPDQSPLHFAAYFGRIKLVKLLLSHGANVDIQTQSKYTPLHLAILYEHFWVVEILLKANANIEIPTLEGYRPLYLAMYCSNFKIFKMILAAGAQLNAQNGKFGLTVSHLAASNDNRHLGSNTLIVLKPTLTLKIKRAIQHFSSE